MKNVNNFFK